MKITILGLKIKKDYLRTIFNSSSFCGIVLLFLIPILFLSCVTKLKINEISEKDEKYWIIPSLDTEVTSYIGDSLLKEGKSITSDAIILKADHGIVGVTAFHSKGTYKLLGTTIKNKVDSEGDIVGKETVKVYQLNSPMPGMIGTTYPQLFEKEDGSVWYNDTKAGGTPVQPDDYSKDTIIDSDDYYFEQQLIYTGAEGNILKFTYREFADGTARPAFTIDATYDLSKDNRIRFKGAVLDIINYDNQTITYKVISGFKS